MRDPCRWPHCYGKEPEYCNCDRCWARCLRFSLWIAVGLGLALLFTGMPPARGNELPYSCEQVRRAAGRYGVENLDEVAKRVGLTVTPGIVREVSACLNLRSPDTLVNAVQEKRAKRDRRGRRRR